MSGFIVPGTMNRFPQEAGAFPAEAVWGERCRTAGSAAQSPLAQPRLAHPCLLWDIRVIQPQEGTFHAWSSAQGTHCACSLLRDHQHPMHWLTGSASPVKQH